MPAITCVVQASNKGRHIAYPGRTAHIVLPGIHIHQENAGTKPQKKDAFGQKKSHLPSQARITSVDRMNSGRRNHPVRISTASSIRRSFKMAIPTPVNGQITDAVTQANVKVLGDAPAMAMGSIFQSLAHSTGILYENAVSAQQQLGISSQAATNQGVIQIYSIDTMADAVATSKIAQSDVPDNMLSLLTTLQAVKS
nr:RebB family R body protein [Thalassospira alkalitolerans]